VPNIGFGEIMVILLLALIIFGPRRLPEMGKTVGRSLREFRKATSEIRSELRTGLDEPPATSVEERARKVAERAPPQGAPPQGTPPQGTAPGAPGETTPPEGEAPPS
jgi:sec-independent protein translocase protein TatA